MNTNISARNNQAFSQVYINLISALGGVLPESCFPQRVSQRRYTPKRIKIIKIILNHINNNDLTQLSHIRIASMCRLSRRAVLQAFKDFEEDGLFEIDHKALEHDMNVYRLGEFFKCREVIFALKNIFGNLYRAFCRTLDRVYNAVVERNIARNLKTHITLSFDKKKRVVFGTNTNTTLSYIRKIYNKVSSVFVKNSNSTVLCFQEIKNREKEMQENQQWLKSADGKTWVNKKKQEHATWGLSHQEKELAKKKERQEPVISKDFGKINPSLMNERLSICSSEVNLPRRLAMYEKLKTQVQRASVPYIDFMIRKTRAKMEM